MRKYLLSFCFILLMSSFSLGQTIAFQDFESGSDDWSYTPSPAVFNVSGDVWDIVDDSWQSSNLTTMASNGTNFWGIQDLANDPNGTAVGEFGSLTFPNVNVSGFSDVEISFDYEVLGYDNGDDMKYETFFDDVSQGEVFIIEGGTGGISGSGTISISVPNGTGTVSLIVSVAQNGGSDYAGLDNFKVAVASGPDPEPSNHATSFSAIANGHNQIDLGWSDATGAQLPAGYLIKGSDVSFAAITAPVDGTPEADAGLVKNVTQGDETTTIIGLTETTQYFFKIFPYTNAGANIDYKIDGTVPQDDATTDAAPALPNAWINEFHYDNVDTDASEFVEIIIEDAVIYTLSDFQVNLYNGSNGTSYNSKTIDTYTVGDIANENGKTFNLYYFVYPVNGLQNGDPDGLALSYQGSLIQFLSYEGSFSATDGPASGLPSTDVGISQTSSTSLGSSLGLEGSGTQYSDFTWASFDASATPGSQNGSQALPVELTSFSASVIKNSVKLVWNTATEINNYGFEVQSSADKEAWSNVGFINGNGTTNSPKDYSFVDDKLSNSGSYYYRLKQVDNDGSYEYSKTIEVVLGTPTAYKLDQNYPNPFNPTTLISFTLPEAGFTNLVIFNSLGQEIAILVNDQLEAGTHQYNFDAKNLTSGIYFYKLESENFVQGRKMMLLK